MIKGDFKFLTTGHPMIVFEDSAVGRLKKKIFDASMEEIDAILAEYEVPSPSELGKAGTYIQNSPRALCVEKRGRTTSCWCRWVARRITACTPTPVWTPSW
jgi:hypothetical protein